MPHGWRPQWKIVAAMPSEVAAATSPSAPPRGAQSVRTPFSVVMPASDVPKWLIGSETP